MTSQSRRRNRARDTTSSRSRWPDPWQVSCLPGLALFLVSSGRRGTRLFPRQGRNSRAARSVPVGVFEDLDGPPSYRLHRDDVTILLAVKQKVVANFAFRAGELSDARI